MKNRAKELSQGSCAMRRNGMGIGRTRNRTRKAGAMLNSEANVNHNLMRNVQKKKNYISNIMINHAKNIQLGDRFHNYVTIQ